MSGVELSDLSRAQTLLKALSEVSSLSLELHADVAHFLKRARDERERWGRKEINLERLCFWYKSLVHALLADAEGISGLLRAQVQIHADALNVKLSARLEKEIFKHYQAPLERSVASSFKAFSIMFEAGFKLDTGGEDFRAFIALLESREDFAHPKTPQSLYPFAMLASVNAAAEWFIIKWKELFVACRQSIGQPATQLVGWVARAKFTDSRLREFIEAGHLYHAKYRARGPLRVFKEMISALSGETDQALLLLRVDHLNPEGSIPEATALRNITRILFSEIEGSVFAAETYLFHLGLRTHIPEESLLKGNHESIRERIVLTIEEISIRFGNQKQLAREGIGWNSFTTSRALRHRLIHPGSDHDLAFRAGELDELFATLGWWHTEVRPCFEIQVAESEAEESESEA